MFVGRDAHEIYHLDPQNVPTLGWQTFLPCTEKRPLKMHSLRPEGRNACTFLCSGRCGTLTCHLSLLLGTWSLRVINFRPALSFQLVFVHLCVSQSVACLSFVCLLDCLFLLFVCSCSLLSLLLFVCLFVCLCLFICLFVCWFVCLSVCHASFVCLYAGWLVGWLMFLFVCLFACLVRSSFGLGRLLLCFMFQ